MVAQPRSNGFFKEVKIGLNRTPARPVSPTANVNPLMKITSITSIIAVLALGSVSLQAKDKPAKGGATDYKPEEVVAKFDKNGDKKLSLEEFSAMGKFKKDKDPAGAAKKAFEEADANKDGSVTAEELMAVHQKKVAKGGDKPAPKTPEKPAKTDAK